MTEWPFPRGNPAYPGEVVNAETGQPVSDGKRREDGLIDGFDGRPMMSNETFYRSGYELGVLLRSRRSEKGNGGGFDVLRLCP